MEKPPPPAAATVRQNVAAALAEDVGALDVTAELIDAGDREHARVISREPGVFCGRPWIEETCRQVDPRIEIVWHVADGDTVEPGDTLWELRGPARGLLTAERTMLNFAQLLSGTATAARRYADRVAGTSTRILDTRKTIPGLRAAQKYAVACGGATNHRMGLFDAFLIKENHIAALGGIGPAIAAARRNHPDKVLEIEVENLDQLHEAIEANPDIILLDNFDVESTTRAVKMTAGKVKLESSGGISGDEVSAFAATGVDYISVGEITKRVEPLDLSMRFVEP